MYLVRLSFVIVALFALNGCADIIPLTGGNRDETAPAPTEMEPVSGTTNVHPTEVKLTFNEYITLKDPSTSVTMSPDVGPITASQDKRTVTISWDQPLKEETTYILSLNGTVRDLNEGNDSIIQVVFSTGNFIDSLQHEGRITSAYSGETISNATICLYEKDSVPFVNQPTYFTRSDKGGFYRFNYVRQAEYNLFAFQDNNKNTKVDANENIAFTTEKINFQDTVPSQLRLFKPKSTMNKLRIVLDKPGLATLSGVNFDSTNVTINRETPVVLRKLRFDSIQVVLPNSINDNYSFATATDTITRRHVMADRKANFAVRLESSKQWKKGDTLTFSTNEFIENLDRNALKLVNDYGKEISYNSFVNNGQLQLLPETNENFTVIFGKNALAGKQNFSDTTRYKFETFTSEKYGEIALDVSEFEGNWVFELIDNANTEQGKVVARQNGTGGKLIFKELIPGQYSIRCFKDENGNGTWDSGDFAEKRQPEIMLRFPVKQKVRANWEIEETLTPN